MVQSAPVGQTRQPARYPLGLYRRSYLFSEGCTLYLWQIRHFPSTRFILRRPQDTSGAGSKGLPAISTGRVCRDPERFLPRILMALWVLWLTNLPLEAQPQPEVQSESAVSAANPAMEYLRQAHLGLLSRQSIQAEIYELVHLTDPPFHMTGTYASSGLRTRLSYTVKLSSGASGSLLEVCDGERLWSVTDVPKLKRVTRRDVRQILAAAEQARSRPDRALAADLALGGLPALLASLQHSMDFDAMKEDTSQGRTFTLIQGRWKPEWRKKLGGEQLPPHVPDLVRVYFAADNQFPERFLYLKKAEDKNYYRPLVDLQFRKVVLDAPLDEKLFEFTPPENVEPEDVTRQYLDQLFPPENKAKNAGATSPPASPKP